MRNKQKGFGLVPVLMVLILVSVIGFAGYYVWNNQYKKKETTQQPETQKPINTNSVKPTETTKPSTSADNQNYLVIKEWGVKIPLTSDIEDAGYTINPNGPAETEQSVWIYKKAYVDISSSCDKLYNITRFSNPSAKIDWYGDISTLGERYKNISYKIGNYYYAPVGPQGPCGNPVGNDANPSFADQVKTNQAFSVALKNIVVN